MRPTPGVPESEGCSEIATPRSRSVDEPQLPQQLEIGRAPGGLGVPRGRHRRPSARGCRRLSNPGPSVTQ